MARPSNIALSRWFQRYALPPRPWIPHARCGGHQDLPWINDTAPTFDQHAKMAEICSNCPVIASCAAYGLTAIGGFYAGVWIPWKMAGNESDYNKIIRLRGRRELKQIAMKGRQ